MNLWEIGAIAYVGMGLVTMIYLAVEEIRSTQGDDEDEDAVIMLFLGLLFWPFFVIWIIHDHLPSRDRQKEKP